jgi:ABC-type transport system involved in multi-copper enzyme maturation permease subunit
MTELTQPQPKSRFRRLRALLQNPITVKELRSRMRGRRAFVVLSVYLALMSAFISLIYLAYAQSAGGPYGPDPRQAGKVVFSAVLGVQVFLVIFIGPAFTAGAISGEKERQTYDLLRTTLLTAKSFVAGKLFSALSYVFLLILAAVPLQSIAFLLGGVSPIELILSQLLLLVAAVVFALFGLFVSSRMKTTLAASVTTFAIALFFTMGIPLVVLIFGSVLSPILFGASSLSWVGEMALAYGGLFLAATNLPATLIVSDIFLLQEDALFFYKETFGGSHSAYLFSPWPLFLLFYILLAFLLYWLTVRKVRKIADK